MAEHVVYNLLKVGAPTVVARGKARPSPHVLELDGCIAASAVCVSGDAHVLCEIEMDVVVVEEGLVGAVAGHGPGGVGGGTDCPDELGVGGGQFALDGVVEREGEGCAHAAGDEEDAGGAPGEEVLEVFADGTVWAFDGEGDFVVVEGGGWSSELGKDVGHGACSLSGDEGDALAVVVGGSDGEGVEEDVKGEGFGGWVFAGPAFGGDAEIDVGAWLRAELFNLFRGHRSGDFDEVCSRDGLECRSRVSRGESAVGNVHEEHDDAPDDVYTSRMSVEEEQHGGKQCDTQVRDEE